MNSLTNLGPPYGSMPADQREAWAAFAAEMPWLDRSHRQIVRLACLMSVRAIRSDATDDELSAFADLLGKLMPSFGSVRSIA